MKYISTSLVLFLCFLTAMVEGLTRYQTTPPSDAIVCHDRQALNDLALAHPDGLLYPENGGYYLKDGDEVVVGIASDDLCTELDGAFASIDAKIAQEGEGAGSEDNTSDAENVIKRAENALHNSCRHPRCFTHPHCLTYSHCHICSSRKHCI
ncbi:hypothetical protein N7449_008665 [Penicillium cf. viridicatum]|uniref:Uncharacterized protein n=1 Tax=Penicillium cf. viridicatum TaxID=2972119 RepID=A0A9W9J8N1_9EURO|nr:hypothetical protein N7449_008665 [Penicillium cf. viridicatum]